MITSKSVGSETTSKGSAVTTVVLPKGRSNGGQIGDTSKGRGRRAADRESTSKRFFLIASCHVDEIVVEVTAGSRELPTAYLTAFVLPAFLLPPVLFFPSLFSRQLQSNGFPLSLLLSVVAAVLSLVRYD